MVKTILAGLVVAGVAPTIVADATAIESSQNNVLANTEKAAPDNFASLCTVPNSWKVCNKLSTTKETNFSSDFDLSSIASLLRTRSIAFGCAGRSPGQQWQNQATHFNLSLHQSNLSLRQSKCIFPWQSKLGKKSKVQENITLVSQRNSQKLTKLESTRSVTFSPQFPKLSRSSLIVSFPQQIESSFKSEKLAANPAPSTKRVASPFGWRTRPYSNQLQFHQGIDYGAPLSSPVVAIGNGIVTKVSSGCADFGNLFCGGQLGNWIEIDHGNGAIATYGHLKNSSIAIKQGMKVQRNQQIAEVGSSGWSTGAHLDFRLKINGEYENPAKYVAAINKARI